MLMLLVAQARLVQRARMMPPKLVPQLQLQMQIQAPVSVSVPMQARPSPEHSHPSTR